MPDKKILVIDDEEELLELIDKSLSAEGYVVTTAATAQDAIKKSKTFVPDLVLIDIVLPDMEGPEVIQILNKDFPNGHIRAIFLSGIITRNREKEAVTEIRVGEQFYKALSKPFSFPELLGEVRKSIGWAPKSDLA